jgi:2-oxoglutarate dehydrogenase E2 component (dihydrolipoamide succinyltransferase)
MANAEIKIPAVGESITEATIAQWLKKDGDIVKRDDILLSLETDKATVEVVAEHAGKLKIKTKEGETVQIGAVVGEIDTSAAAETITTASEPKAQASPTPKGSAPAAAAPASTNHEQNLSPAVRRVVAENPIDLESVSGSGRNGQITKGDVLQALKNPAPASAPKAASPAASPTPLPQVRATGTMTAQQTREPMTKLRQTIARRLVEAQHTAAILTTFNEIDMTEVMALRKKYKEKFKERHNVNLGFMGFFVKACIEALKAYPRINGYIEGTEIVYNHYYNVGIAVGTEKGLIVPVIRNAEMLTLAEVELTIKHYAEKARENKIGINDLSGGTFTISNGGVYGSLMSTPILNPPQSGILGLHKIEERPMAVNGKIEIRPMMYVALSYDHRMVDGGEAVGFLVKIKEGIEDPSRLLLEI